MGLPRFIIITAPMDQKFDVIRKVRSLAVYAFNDSFFCISLPLRFQRIIEVDLVANRISTSCYSNRHGTSRYKLKVQWKLNEGSMVIGNRGDFSKAVSRI